MCGQTRSLCTYAAFLCRYDEELKGWDTLVERKEEELKTGESSLLPEIDDAFLKQHLTDEHWKILQETIDTDSYSAFLGKVEQQLDEIVGVHPRSLFLPPLPAILYLSSRPFLSLSLSLSDQPVIFTYVELMSRSDSTCFSTDETTTLPFFLGLPFPCNCTFQEESLDREVQAVAVEKKNLEDKLSVEQNRWAAILLPPETPRALVRDIKHHVVANPGQS